MLALCLSLVWQSHSQQSFIEASHLGDSSFLGLNCLASILNICFSLSFFLATLHSLQDLSSPTRD